MSETKISSELDKSLQDLETYCTKYDIGCIKNAVVVLKDQKIPRQTFIKHILQDEDFVGVTCHGFGIDSIEIVFRFQCRAPRICLIAPAFAVQYDISD